MMYDTVEGSAAWSTLYDISVSNNNNKYRYVCMYGDVPGQASCMFLLLPASFGYLYVLLSAYQKKTKIRKIAFSYYIGFLISTIS
jgi:hypothetical protein